MEEYGNNEDMEEAAKCRKFGIILGGFRTEVEVLADLHLRYAILISKDDRSRILLAELKAINGKECSFRPLGNQTRKVYIMIGVPSCVVQGTTEAGQGGTRSLPDDKMEYRETKVRTHKHDKGNTGRETTPRQIYKRVREFLNDALCERTIAELELSEVWPPGQDLQVRYPDMQVLRWKTLRRWHRDSINPDMA